MDLICARFSSNPDIVKASENRAPLKFGMTGEAIKILQMALIDLGSDLPISTRKREALPDGIFGKETLQSTIAFQRLSGLAPDGIVGAKTIEKLDTLLAARSELTVRTDRLLGKKGLGRG